MITIMGVTYSDGCKHICTHKNQHNNSHVKTNRIRELILLYQGLSNAFILYSQQQEDHLLDSKQLQ